MSGSSPDPDDDPTAGDRADEAADAQTYDSDDQAERQADSNGEFSWGAGGESTADGPEDSAVDDGDDSDEHGSGSVRGAGSSVDDRLPDLPFGLEPVIAGVVAISVLALFARFVALGARPAHFDEARVAYWALYTQETGNFAYRSIVHGPFIQHVDRFLFGVFGANDFVMRAPVALVGGLFPVSALLFRNQLRDEETVALAFLLAFNPILLYYSRFMRSDVLVAAFMFTALGFLVRLAESRKLRYLYGAAIFGALGIASKENSLLYILTWVGAGALVLDRALDRPGTNASGIDRLVSWGSAARSWLGAHSKPQNRRKLLLYGVQILGAILVFALVWLFMYAPRGDGLEGLKTLPEASKTTVGLWQAIGDPGQWLGLFENTYNRFLDQFLGFSDQNKGLTLESYRTRLEDTIRNGIGKTSAPLVLFGIAGFVRERYASAEGRILVFFMSYAAAASLIGYPLGYSIATSWKWVTMHILLPLSIPAAVGVGTIYRWGREASRENDPVDIGLTAFILLLAVSTMAFNAYPMYANPQHESNTVVQFAQPTDDLEPMFQALQDGSSSAGTDVVVFSHRDMPVPLVKPLGVEERWNVKPTCTVLGHFLPAQWYVAAADTEGDCARNPSVLKQMVQDENVPVVITKVRDSTVPREWLRERYTHVGNFSLRFEERADPTLEVWSRPVDGS